MTTKRKDAMMITKLRNQIESQVEYIIFLEEELERMITMDEKKRTQIRLIKVAYKELKNKTILLKSLCI